MEKMKNKNFKEFILKTIIIIQTIIIILLLLRFYNKKTIAFNGNGAEGTMGQIRVYSDETVTIEENKFTKEGYEFSGWSLYDDKNETWKCEEGWFTEQEIEENGYKQISYSTEEINNYFNQMDKGKITAYATWGKAEENKVTKEENTVLDKTIENNTKEENTGLDKTTENNIKEEKIKCEKHVYISKNTKKATCTENGEKKYVCLNCGDTITEEIQATGHVYIEKIVRVPNNKGKIIKLYICTKCPHQYEEVLKENCSEHIYTSKITKKATCTENGIKTYICVDCEEEYTEEIKALGHNYTEEIVNNPTCNKKGNKKFVCQNCKNEYTEKIEKLEHKYIETVIKEATHEEAGKKTLECTMCKEKHEEEIPKLEYTDLEKLQMALIGRQMKEEELGAEIEIDGLKIKFGTEAYFITEEEIMIRLNYNGNEYIISVNGDVIGTNVKKVEKIEEQFKFDEFYSMVQTEGYDEDELMTITVNQNGDLSIYQTSTAIISETMPKGAKVFENKLYIKQDENVYYLMATVSESGTILISSMDGDVMKFKWDPDFKAKKEEMDKLLGFTRGYYKGEVVEQGQSRGMIVELDNTVYYCIGLGNNKVMPLLVTKMYVEPGFKTINLKDKGETVIVNPIISESWNTPPQKQLIGYVSGNTIYLLGEVTSTTNPKTYEIVDTLTYTEFPCDRIKVDKLYKNGTGAEENIIGINDSEQAMYIGITAFDRKFWSAGPLKYTVQETFIANLEDGTTKEIKNAIIVTGKQVSSSGDLDITELENTVEHSTIYGYFEGNDIVLLNVDIIERDENDNPILFKYIDVAEDSKFVLQ